MRRAVEEKAEALGCKIGGRHDLGMEEEAEADGPRQWRRRRTRQALEEEAVASGCE